MTEEIPPFFLPPLNLVKYIQVAKRLPDIFLFQGAAGSGQVDGNGWWIPPSGADIIDENNLWDGSSSFVLDDGKYFINAWATAGVPTTATLNLRLSQWVEKDVTLVRSLNSFNINDFTSTRNISTDPITFIVDKNDGSDGSILTIGLIQDPPTLSSPVITFMGYRIAAS